MNDSEYGSSQYRQFPPISSKLKVASGSNKPARVRQQRTNFKPEGLGPIQRGDRSQTLWKKGQANQNIVPSDSLDEASQTFSDPSGDDTPII